MIRRLTAALLATGIAVAAWAPAAAAAPPSGGITAPGDGQTLATATPTISVEFVQPAVAGQSGTVDEVTITLRGLQGQPLPSNASITRQSSSSQVAFSWTTPRLPYNGTYAAEAVARGSDAVETNGPETTRSVRNFAVEAPPATPASVRASVNGDQSVRVAWANNSEPDLVGYQLQRQRSGSKADPETYTTTGSELTDHPAPGNWEYRVVALRKGANGDTLVASNPSRAAAATVAAPPQSTSTSSAGGGGGSSPSDGGDPSSGEGSSQSSPAVGRAGRVDLSGFASLLDANRDAAARQAELFDPGFDESLPFAGRPAEPELGAEDEELGQDEPNVGLGQEPISDDGDRRRSLSFLAGGLLAFVLMMQVLWVRGEVNRADDLEPLASELSGLPPPSEPT